MLAAIHDTLLVKNGDDALALTYHNFSLLVGQAASIDLQGTRPDIVRLCSDIISSVFRSAPVT